MKRSPVFLSLLLLAAIAAGGALWILGNHKSNSVPSVSTGKATIGGPFSLTNQDGKQVTNADYSGRTMVIYFGYTHCPDICPTTLSVMGEALSKLGADEKRIVPIFVTLDPERDTPKVLKSYLAAFGPRFVGLTGNAQEIALIKKEYHVYSEKQPMPGGDYAVNHSNTIYVMGPDGSFIDNFDETLGPDAMAARLRKDL